MPQTRERHTEYMREYRARQKLSFAALKAEVERLQKDNFLLDILRQKISELISEQEKLMEQMKSCDLELCGVINERLREIDAQQKILLEIFEEFEQSRKTKKVKK